MLCESLNTFFEITRICIETITYFLINNNAPVLFDTETFVEKKQPTNDDRKKQKNNADREEKNDDDREKQKNADREEKNDDDTEAQQNDEETDIVMMDNNKKKIKDVPKKNVFEFDVEMIDDNNHNYNNNNNNNNEQINNNNNTLQDKVKKFVGVSLTSMVTLILILACKDFDMSYNYEIDKKQATKKQNKRMTQMVEKHYRNRQYRNYRNKATSNQRGTVQTVAQLKSNYKKPNKVPMIVYY